MDEIYRSNDNLLITEDMLPFLGTCFQNGIISLTLVDAIALHVFENCEECRNYIKAKYTHVFIDEYQDCGYLQDRLFLALINLGVIGIAVGDKDQAIYGFAGKDSKYLIGLPKEHGIKTFLLDRNFRCHPQIRDYALRLLDGVTEPETKDCRVIRLACKGNELNIAKAIDMFVQLFRDKKIIEHNSQVAILTRSERTGGMISHNLKEKNIFFKKTPLDEDSSRQGLIFKEMLIAILGKDHEIFGLCNSYISIDDDKKRYDYAYTVLMKLRKKGMIEISLNEFVEASYLFIPYEQKNEKSIEKLEEVVGTEDYWITYTPQDKDSVQIMTLHKSKGLEFKVVFHLDLYRYIMPREQFNPNRYIDMEETINLHYVGITRAEEYSFLVTSEHRTNSQGSVTSGIESPLLSMHNLSSYTTPAKDLYNFLDSEDPRL
jgi:DNA helicase-2/ATP-dependent DNA helicase PcrA